MKISCINEVGDNFPPGQSAMKPIGEFVATYFGMI